MTRFLCRFLGLFSLVLICSGSPSFVQAAAIIDKETKEAVIGIEERLVEIQRDLRQQNAAELNAIQAIQPTQAPAIRETSKGTEALLQGILEKIETLKSAQEAALEKIAAATAAGASAAPSTSPLPAMSPDETSQITKKLQNLEINTNLLILLMLVIVIGAIGLVIFVKQGEERIRQAIWKAEISNLKPELLGRPHLKIQADHSRLSLVNTGETSADGIRLFVGPAPATMRQRQRAVGKIEAGQTVELDLANQISAEVLYGTVEYKNSLTGKLYKDQFVLKFDPDSGQLVPESLAS